jgi:hypothetical protein
MKEQPLMCHVSINTLLRYVPESVDGINRNYCAILRVNVPNVQRHRSDQLHLAATRTGNDGRPQQKE